MGVNGEGSVDPQGDDLCYEGRSSQEVALEWNRSQFQARLVELSRYGFLQPGSWTARTKRYQKVDMHAVCINVDLLSRIFRGQNLYISNIGLHVI